MPKLDDLDRAIIYYLQTNFRMSCQDIADKIAVKVTRQTISKRIKKMIENRLIEWDIYEICPECNQRKKKK